MRRRFLNAMDSSILMQYTGDFADKYYKVAKYLKEKYPSLPVSFKPTNSLSIEGVEDITILDPNNLTDCAGKVVGLSINDANEPNKIFLWTEASKTSMYVFFIYIGEATEFGRLQTYLYD